MTMADILIQGAKMAIRVDNETRKVFRVNGQTRAAIRAYLSENNLDVDPIHFHSFPWLKPSTD